MINKFLVYINCINVTPRISPRAQFYELKTENAGAHKPSIYMVAKSFFIYITFVVASDVYNIYM